MLGKESVACCCAAEVRFRFLLQGTRAASLCQSRCIAQENILRRNEAKDNRKIPLVRSPVWARRRGILPAADANTVRSPMPTDSCGCGCCGCFGVAGVAVASLCVRRNRDGQGELKSRAAPRGASDPQAAAVRLND